MFPTEDSTVRLLTKNSVNCKKIKNAKKIRGKPEKIAYIYMKGCVKRGKHENDYS